MKKLILTAICIAAFFVFSASISYAAKDIVSESPNVKIIIDGKTSTYSSTPIIVNGRTLLPFREVLNKLGVPNDDRHIIWNGTEKSVTINKDSTKIYLKIGSKTAYVNNRAVTIDVAPIIYKSRTYIPARFIAQSLGMKVSWDPVSTTVLLRNETDYNNVKSILDKVYRAMNSLERLKAVELGSTSIIVSGVEISSDTRIDSMIDYKNKFMHYVIDSNIRLGQDVESEEIEVYTDGSKLYVKTEGNWTGSRLDEQQSREMFTFSDLVSDDILCSGLYVYSESSNKIILKGNINLKSYTDGYFELQGFESYSFRNVSAEITIDKNTYYLDKISMSITAVSKSIEDAVINTKLDAVYTDFNGKLEFNPPQGLALRAPVYSPISTPTPTTTPTRTPGPSVTPTATPVRTPAPSVTPTRTPVPTVTPTLTPVTGGLTVKMFNSNTQGTSNFISPTFQLVNNGSSAINLQDVKLRYYFTVNGDKSQNFWCDWSNAGNTNVTGKFVKTASSGNRYDYYLEIGFNAGAGRLEPGKTVEVKTRFSKEDWSNYTQTDDYSFNATATDYTVWDKVTAYISDRLVWGITP
ncbi:MAG: stalk domain-containing protein [Bacillota bacterium]